MPQTLSTPRPLATPTRDSLLREFRAHEFRNLVLIGIEIAILTAGFSWWFLQLQSSTDPVQDG